MTGFKFFRPCAELGNIVEGIWSVDLSDNSASKLVIKVLPTASPILCFHVRAQTVSEPGMVFTSRQRMTGVMTRALTLRPSGPMRSIMVRLRPEAAFRIVGAGMHDLIDAAVPLGDIINPTQSFLLEEKLSEASDTMMRVATVESFLIRRLRGEPDPLVHQAAAFMRRNPGLTIGCLASRLGIGGRHLERHFRAVTGTSPKQFSRIVRIENVVRKARRGASTWADIAYSCGFSDKAHMINEFKSMVGAPPTNFFRAAVAGKNRVWDASFSASNSRTRSLSAQMTKQGRPLNPLANFPCASIRAFGPTIGFSCRLLSIDPARSRHVGSWWRLAQLGDSSRIGAI